jgi:hypothetical protein
VTWLEPRTPHQPEKLKKLSKNEYGFTPSIFGVNEKYGIVSTCVFSRVQAVHRHVTGNSAGRNSDSRRSRTGCGISSDSFIEIEVKDYAEDCDVIVNIPQTPRGTRDWENLRFSEIFSLDI